jgi:hypothetical protein
MSYIHSFYELSFITSLQYDVSWREMLKVTPFLHLLNFWKILRIYTKRLNISQHPDVLHRVPSVLVYLACIRELSRPPNIGRLFSEHIKFQQKGEWKINLKESPWVRVMENKSPAQAGFSLADFLPWRWRRYDPLKHRFTQDLYGATSQKTAFFKAFIFL